MEGGNTDKIAVLKTPTPPIAKFLCALVCSPRHGHSRGSSGVLAPLHGTDSDLVLLINMM